MTTQIDPSITLIAIGGFLVTIVGWCVAYIFQRRLVVLQKRFDQQKDMQQITVPRKIEQLEAVREWLREGYRVWGQVKELDKPGMTDEELRRRLNVISESISTWYIDGYHHIAVARQFDPPDLSKPLFRMQTGEEEHFQTGLTALSTMLSIEIATSVNYPLHHGAEDIGAALTIAVANRERVGLFYDLALKHVEALIEQTAKSHLRN
ncbi:MAG: hypothetical protein HZB53_15945 [Chloroflexi bacterium]|nr:hypothetical protein [Chloroflexota bacterium]